ncbi:MAG: glycosyltransferase family 4 protein [Patescibacteria group bacterium]|nr:glycosyltransferase family 4 protein [Patescibacteria group bacterium]
MKIAQLAPPWISVPPTGYGGTEMIVHYLTEELVRRGHDVTLFASGDSKTKARLSSVFKSAIGNSGELKNQPLNPLLHYIECFEQASKFDMIHNHAQYYAMFLADLVKTPVVHTIHGSFSKEDVPQADKRQTLKKFKDHNFVSISNSQRRGLNILNYVATVYNGIDISEFPFSSKKGEYLCWMGRITQKKGPVDAVETAKILKMKLKISGAVDPIDREYCETVLKPLIFDQKNNGLIEFKEEIKREEKALLYRDALCTLYPIRWEEPFGLVMAESMSCGTPVIAYNYGSVPEIIKDGVTGFIVDPDDEPRSMKGSFIIKKQGIEGLVEAVKRIKEIDRAACRRHIEENFTIERMVDGYEKVYHEIISNKTGF